MSYDLDEMIAKFRSEMEDTVEPFLWSEDEIVDYLDEAQDEFAQLTDAIADAITISYTASESEVDLPFYVTRIRDGFVTASGLILNLFNHEEWDEYIESDDYGMRLVNKDWMSKTASEPEAVITDTESGKLRFYPIPTVDGSVTLRVYRRPIKDLGSAGKFEITDRMKQRVFLKKAKAIAYRKHDAEAFNPQLAQELEQQFEQGIMELKSRVARARRRSKAVAYGGL